MNTKYQKLILAGGLVLAALVIGSLIAGRIYIATKVPDWIQQLNSDDSQVRRDAALCLNEFAPITDEVRRALGRGLDDTYEGVRQQAAYALGKYGNEARTAVPKLVRRLHDEDETVRANAATSLGRIGDSSDDVVLSLTKATNDPNPYVANRASQALLQLGK